MGTDGHDADLKVLTVFANLTSFPASHILNLQTGATGFDRGFDDRRMPCRASLSSSLKSLGKKQLPTLTS